MVVPDEARFGRLLALPESADIAGEIARAMTAIERENDDLRGVLPRNFAHLDKRLLVSLLKTLNFDPRGVEGDVFGKIYQYCLGKFALSEGQKGGEFFTPPPLVKLIVEIIEPYHGYILDPSNGSGGMFVESAHFIERHKKQPMNEIAICDVEKVDETVRLCRMNLAVHGLAGTLRQGNSYYEDIHQSVGKFDFVMANPPSMSIAWTRKN
jgi:type I restriction enzyme M protein